MKTLKVKNILFFLFISFFIFSCSSDESPSVDIDSIYDKWWHDVDSSWISQYFHADGFYEQKTFYLGNTTLSAEGNWYWEDKEEGIMKLENVTGGGITDSEYWYRISDIKNNSITITWSGDGTNFSIDANFRDTQ